MLYIILTRDFVIVGGGWSSIGKMRSLEPPKITRRVALGLGEGAEGGGMGHGAPKLLPKLLLCLCSAESSAPLVLNGA